MQWTVEGAEATSGAERVITVEADTQAQAERIARTRGLLVSEVHRPVNLSAAEALGQMVEDSNGAASGIPVAHVTLPAQAINYQSLLSVTAIPDYKGLRVGASLLSMFAGLYFLAAIVMLIGVIVLAADPSAPRGLTIFMAASWGVTSAAIGGLFLALSSACRALRDIARNSFAK